MKKTFTFFLMTLFTTILWSQDHIVGVTNNVFTPADITITQGETIEWQNTQGNHNVNGTLATFSNNPEGFGNALGSGWTFQHTFNTAGTYNYQCDPHVSIGMVGTVTVNPASSGSVNDLVITEIMYNPPEGGQDSLEFIEILNTGSAAVNVGGLYFTQGVTDTLPDMMVGAGEYLMLAVNATAFQNTFGIPAVQWESGSLSNSGEDIELVDASGNVIDFVLYDDNAPWSSFADGPGGSLVLCDPSSDNNDPANWSVAYTGTGISIDGREIFANPNAASSCPAGPVVSFLGSGITVNEADGMASMQVIIEGGNAMATDVTISILGGSTATVDADYSLGFAFPVTANFPAGNALDTLTFSIGIIDDADVEGIENILFELSGPTNGAIISPFANGFEIEILDNDASIPDLVITEIMYNPPESGQDSTEYIEVLNNGLEAVDMEGYAFTSGVDFTFPAMMVQPGEYAVVSVNAAAFQAYYGTTPLQWDEGGSLSNGGETIALSNPGGTVVDEVSYDDGGDWTNIPDGNGPSLILCDPASDNNVGTNWSSATTLSGAMVDGVEIKASPGAANVCGTTGGPTYPQYAIGVLTADSDNNGLPDSINVTAEITGVVYGIDLNGGDPLQFTIIDANNDGIGVIEFDASTYTVTEGDEITIKGNINHFNGLAQIAPDEITFNSAGNTLFEPTVVTALDETTESQLIKMNNMTLVDATQWDNSSTSGFNVDITDGTNMFLMRIDNECALYNAPAPTTPFNITGIGGQFDSSEPYDGGYQILPRFDSDLEPIVSTNDPELGKSISLFPNPVNEVLQIKMENTIDVIRVHNVLGQEMLALISPNASEELAVTNWNSGIYSITFTSGNKTWTTQFVKH